MASKLIPSLLALVAILGIVLALGLIFHREDDMSIRLNATMRAPNSLAFPPGPAGGGLTTPKTFFDSGPKPGSSWSVDTISATAAWVPTNPDVGYNTGQVNLYVNARLIVSLPMAKQSTDPSNSLTTWVCAETLAAPLILYPGDQLSFAFGTTIINAQIGFNGVSPSSVEITGTIEPYRRGLGQ